MELEAPEQVDEEEAEDEVSEEFISSLPACVRSCLKLYCQLTSASLVYQKDGNTHLLLPSLPLRVSSFSPNLQKATPF